METIYWLAAFSGLAALLCMRARAAVPAVVFTAIALVLVLLTPFGQDLFTTLVNAGDRVANGEAK